LPFDLKKTKITINISGKRYIIMEKDYKIHTFKIPSIKKGGNRPHFLCLPPA